MDYLSDLVSKIICEVAWRLGATGVRVIKPHAVKAYSYTKPAVCVKASEVYDQLGWFGWMWFLATVGGLGFTIAVGELWGSSPPMWAIILSPLAIILPALALCLLVWDGYKAVCRRVWALASRVSTWLSLLKRLPR